MQGLIILVVLGVVALLLMKEYQGLAKMDKQIKNAWSSRDLLFKNQLKIIDAFLSSSRYYIRGENQLINQVSKISNSSKKMELSEQRLTIESELDNFLEILIRRVSQEKEIKRIKSFAEINNELSSIRQKLGHAKKAYNEIAVIFNKKINSVPGNLVAGLGKLKKYPLDKKGRSIF